MRIGGSSHPVLSVLTSFYQLFICTSCDEKVMRTPSSSLLMAKGGETSSHEPLEAVEIVGCNTCVDRKEAPFWFRLAHT